MKSKAKIFLFPLLISVFSFNLFAQDLQPETSRCAEIKKIFFFNSGNDICEEVLIIDQLIFNSSFDELKDHFKLENNTGKTLIDFALNNTSISVQEPYSEKVTNFINEDLPPQNYFYEDVVYDSSVEAVNISNYFFGGSNSVEKLIITPGGGEPIEIKDHTKAILVFSQSFQMGEQSSYYYFLNLINRWSLIFHEINHFYQGQFNGHIKCKDSDKFPACDHNGGSNWVEHKLIEVFLEAFDKNINFNNREYIFPSVLKKTLALKAEKLKRRVINPDSNILPHTHIRF